MKDNEKITCEARRAIRSFRVKEICILLDDEIESKSSFLEGIRGKVDLLQVVGMQCDDGIVNV